MTNWIKKNWWWIALLIVGFVGAYFNLMPSDKDLQLAKARQAKADKKETEDSQEVPFEDVSINPDITNDGEN